uniref:Uncharacterized protein n=1 Tax=Arundo donax TaxID=35708 RepID=A0A0A9A2F8_ARUDO
MLLVVSIQAKDYPQKKSTQAKEIQLSRLVT